MVSRKKPPTSAAPDAAGRRPEPVADGRRAGAALQALISSSVEWNIEKWGPGISALEAEAHAYPALPDGSTDALSDFFRSNDVPFYEGRSVRSVVALLAQFERHRAQEVRTTRERVGALEAVEQNARALLDALGAMPARNERTHLEHSLRDVGWLAGEGAGDGEEDLFNGGDPARVSATMTVLRALIEGAQHARGSVAIDGKSGGRADVVSERARFVWMLAGCTQRLGYKLGRGGKFEALCVAAFSVAGVPAAPEGAIRYAATYYGGPGQPEGESAGRPESGTDGGDN